MSNKAQDMSKIKGYITHMNEEKKRINAFVPAQLYEQVMSKGYSTITEAIIKGFERLLEEPEANIPERPSSLNDELLTSLQNQIKSIEYKLSQAPNPAELEGLQKLLGEKDERIKDLSREIEGLKKEVERLDMFAHYFKSVEVKQIEAPGAKKPWWKLW
jgi:predicted  nucleic acid-binding Zn-ribbon protein